MTHVNDGENQTLTGKSYSECHDLASRLAGSYVGAARNKNKSEILKIIQDGVSFAFVDLPSQLSFLEAALLPFVSKLPSPDIPDMYVIGLHAFFVLRLLQMFNFELPFCM
jgi:cohesin complex subunit SA-1/2